jgi:hypothetical protein
LQIIQEFLNITTPIVKLFLLSQNAL